MDDRIPPLVFARDLRGPYDSRREHARSVLRGVEHRVSHGVYALADAWNDLAAVEQYRLRARAVVATRRTPGVVSHETAAILHGLPLLGIPLTDVHFTVPPATGGRSYPAVVKHGLPLAPEDIVELDGIAVTSLARTAVDLGAALDFLPAVAVADRVLHQDHWGRSDHGLTKLDLLSAHERRMPFKGHVRSLAVCEFAVTQSDSVLESISRVNMHAIGCPRPVLQQRFDDHRGLIGFSEFYWEEHRMVGEADGRSKYTDPAYRRGRSLEQVLLDEKERADRLRAIGLRVARWGWSTAINAEALRRHLAAEGLPTGLHGGVWRPARRLEP